MRIHTSNVPPAHHCAVSKVSYVLIEEIKMRLKGSAVR